MATGETVRRLIVNADDFGRSEDINAAVIQAHEAGILTSASLMVCEPAAGEAVELARSHPRLGVGLHLALVAGQCALPPAAIPDLAGPDGRFRAGAVRAGLRFFFRRRLRDQLAAEIAAQFERFQATGLPLDHVNGHLNLHLHPRVFGFVLAGAGRWGVRGMRLTRDRFWLNARLASGAWAYRVSHAIIFNLLSAWAGPRLRRGGIRHTSRVFGLLQNGRVDETFVLRLLQHLPRGDSELYAHPSLSRFRHEFAALSSARVRAQVHRENIQLIRYQDL